MKKHIIFAIIILLSFTFLFSSDWEQITKIVASDRATEDYFSKDVAISGNYAIVGAYREDHDVSGGDVMHDAGAAYIFQFDGTGWVEMQKLVASDRDVEDFFGYCVDICGNYAIVGAHQNDDSASGNNEGAAYIFYYDGSSWIQQDKLLAIDRDLGDHFGYSVALTEDRAVIGAIYEDDNEFGADSIAQAGSAYIFSRSGTSWSQQAKVYASDRGEDDRFGHKVAISGSYIVVSTPFEDHDADSLNYEVQAGAAYVFYHEVSGWEQKQKLVASDRDAGDYFGFSVDIDGLVIVVGAYMEDHDAGGSDYKEKAGAAYIFHNIGGTWTENMKIVGSERWVSDFFGRDVSIDGDYIVVGADGEDHDTLAANYIANAGAAYIFKYIAGNWVEQEKIVAFDRGADDAFGNEVAISGDVVLIGALGEDHDADRANTMTGSGSAYIFSSGIGGTVEPDIYVHSNSVEIVNGDNTPSLADHTDFGTTQITHGTLVKTYFIANTGTGNLTLSAPIITGTNSGDFSLLTAPSDSIVAGASTAFSIVFTPLAVGLREATISIVNNDADENPYTFAIQGTGKTPYSGGSGTELDPYLIANYENLLELSAMTHDWNKFFIQTADIDAEATDSLNFGDHDASLPTPEEAMGFSPIGDSPTMGNRQGVAFSGSYDGGNYTISNLYIYRPFERFIGLFGYV
ncbi:MAG: choice-of-anchor D domain-containing protein, partial [Candidatus Marinimicrobia bacterium]|nr:choice-of-anchor D domain-containing protein [Candidatus Neomarinimicrobiota bacterium]